MWWQTLGEQGIESNVDIVGGEEGEGEEVEEEIDGELKNELGT